MDRIFARYALLENGWKNDVALMVSGGRITALKEGADVRDAGRCFDVVVPGMPNLHSHAFQRAMAGYAERRGNTADSFWSWRAVMYKLALAMTPPQVEAVAAKLYMEMLEAGYTRVGEFHYLHHDSDGRHYDDIAEMAGHIAAAADTAGISLTLLPVFYAHAGFGGQAPAAGQRRFINSRDSYQRLLEACRRHLAPLRQAHLGIAPHSLRAVTPAELFEITALNPEALCHIHVSEQVREVEDCVAWSGLRPVEWLLEHVPIDQRWCMIHATHMNENETVRLARSGAVAGLCPVTEANLGDGVFNAPEFLGNNGRIGIGSDSNIRISVSEELRQLEYSVRLDQKIRNAIARPGESSGQNLFQLALNGGAQALGGCHMIGPGRSADFIALSLNGQDWIKPDVMLDNWIFAENLTVDSVFIGGKCLVENGRHLSREVIDRRFNEAMNRIFSD